jgi:hypothetical protein
MLFSMDGMCLTSMWYFNLKVVGGAKVDVALASELTCWFLAHGMK